VEFFRAPMRAAKVLHMYRMRIHFAAQQRKRQATWPYSMKARAGQKACTKSSRYSVTIRKSRSNPLVLASGARLFG
jgi:hypothetical protein